MEKRAPPPKAPVDRVKMNLGDQHYMWKCPQCEKFNPRKWVSIWESSTCITCDKFTNGTEAWNNLQKDQTRLTLLQENVPANLNAIVIQKNKEKADAEASIIKQKEAEEQKA